MNLARDKHRCDGLLPKHTQLNGKPALLWAIDCPKRDSCARYLAIKSDDPADILPWTAHFHQPAETCADFIAETGE